MKLTCILLLALGCAPPKASTRIIGYYDTREFSTVHVETLGEEVTSGVRFYGFVDRHGEEEGDLEQTRYFSRFNLRRPFCYGVGPIVEYNDLDGENNGEIGAGPAWEHVFSDRYWVLAAFMQHAHGSGEGKGRIAWDMPVAGPLSFRGFVDGILDDDDSTVRLVTEPEAVLKLWESPFSLVSEFRYNDFDGEHRLGVAAGLEFRWDN